MQKEENIKHLIDFALITLIMLLLVIMAVSWNGLRIDGVISDKANEGNISLGNTTSNDVVGKFQKDDKYVILVKKANSTKFVQVIMEKEVTKEEYDRYIFE